MPEVREALDKVSAPVFEDFFKQFMAQIADDTFLATGGMHDGAADGVATRGFKSSKSDTHFYQASISANPRQKIRDTVRDLRKAGRDPRRLTYVTSQHVQFPDKVENELSDSLDCSIRIRDREFIASQINTNEATRDAFLTYLAPVLRRFISQDRSEGAAPDDLAEVYTFLQLELGQLEEGESFIEALTDSLILWALEGTDPELGMFRTAGEIRERIYGTLPWSKDVIDRFIEKRLTALRDKRYEGGRAVRWYRQEQHYCLPYETRRRIEADYAADEGLRRSVLRGFAERLRELLPDEDEVTILTLANVTMASLHGLMKDQGYDLSSFVSGVVRDEREITVLEQVAKEVQAVGITSNLAQFREAVGAVLRSTIYRSSADEREWLRRLSRVYALMFGLRQGVKLVDFFDGVGRNLRLVVGSDLLIRCISEKYLAEEDQQTRNLLRAANLAGVQLTLTEVVIEEVVHHLRKTNAEFEANWVAVEEHVTEDLARQAPLILIRTYFYARLGLASGSGRPARWANFLNNFVSPDGLMTNQAMAEIKDYFVGLFQMDYLSRAQLLAPADKDRMELFADKLVRSGLKDSTRLARNDALLACAVYGLRNAETGATEYGHRTWWLTQESKLLAAAGTLIDLHGGSRFMLRPEFLLHFLGLAPSTKHARERMGDLFPSMLGVRLTRRLPAKRVHKILAEIAQAEGLETARQKVVVKRAVDALKSDYEKSYGKSLEDEHDG